MSGLGRVSEEWEDGWSLERVVDDPTLLPVWLQPLDVLDQLTEKGVGFEASRIDPDTKVHTPAECELLFGIAGHVESIWFIEAAFIPVG